jgi:C1A family cysteine protease
LKNIFLFKGIFTDAPCNSPDHAVLLVGYDSVKKFWLVKNSWGTWWGSQGYINMAMGKNLISNPSYATV